MTKISPHPPLSPWRLCRNDQEPYSCHSEPFAMCHPERSEGSRFLAQGKLREESDTKCHPERSEGSHEFLRFAQDMLQLTPQNDITTQSRGGKGKSEGAV